MARAEAAKDRRASVWELKLLGSAWTISALWRSAYNGLVPHTGLHWSIGKEGWC
jgi:hypothetical protein